jgi:hypothetical protein
MANWPDSTACGTTSVNTIQAEAGREFEPVFRAARLEFGVGLQVVMEPTAPLTVAAR